MLRGLIKTGIAAGLYWTGADHVIGACYRRKRMPLIIGYHRVVEDFGKSAERAIPSMLISSKMLARHLDWIGRRFEFVAMDDVAAWAEGEKEFRKPVAAVTFDDGYADVYHHGFPVLREKGVPAAVFVITDLVGTRQLQIHDELYLLLSAGFAAWQSPARRLAGLLCGLDSELSLLKSADGSADAAYRTMRALLENLTRADLRRIIEVLRNEVELPQSIVGEHQSLTWEMLREMQPMGFTVGSHTCGHAILTNETWDRIVHETEASRQAVECNLDCEIRHFAYPDGRFNAAVVRAVATAGYGSAYTTCRHRDPAHPRLTIPRRLLWEKSCVDAGGTFSPAVMSCQLNGVFDGANKCTQVHGT